MLSGRGKRRFGEKGQALVITVLVMLVLAALAGLFIALLASQVAQTARQSDLIRLRELAEAGLMHADRALTEGAEGADWRPGKAFYDEGDGRFILNVTYTPGVGDPYSRRFIRVESTAQLYKEGPQEGRTPEQRINPFLRRTVVGFKPVGITDYVRFVTNREERAEPAALGVPLTVSDLDYLTLMTGPLRVNGDLTWYGPVRLELGTEYNVEVAGRIFDDESAEDDRGTAAREDDQSRVYAVINGAAQRVEPSDPVSGSGRVFRTWGGRYRDGVREEDVDGFARWVSRVEPPAVSAKRYRALTADSGEWKEDWGNILRPGSLYNTGWYPNPDDPDGNGVAPGIFIDNASDVQFGHDYESLRESLMGQRPDYWDAPRKRLYTPPGVEITLEPGDALNAPRVILTRHDQGFYRPNPDDTQPGPLPRVSSLVLPFPRNGVITAEGNVRIRGTLPPTRGNPGSRYYVDDNSRHFSLTVVSLGTIYVEGNILSPLTAGLTDEPERDSRIALIAADSVALNTTRFQTLQPVEWRLAAQSSGGLVPYEVGVGEALEMWLSFGATPPASPPTQLFLLHAGAPVMPPAEAGPTIMQLLINHDPDHPTNPIDGRFDWSVGGTVTPFRNPATDYFFSLTANLANVNESNAVAPVLEALPLGTKAVTLYNGTSSYLVRADGTLGAPQPGVVQRIRFEVPPYSQNRYWLYNVAVQPLDIRVDAAIYAAGGSWFVIPGEPFVPERSGAAPAGFPSAGEPLDLRVLVSGAISENRTAPVADVAAWAALWRGSDENWSLSPYPQPPATAVRQVGWSGRQLEYQYDPAVKAARNPSDATSPLRVPHLPVSPGMILFGERI